MTMARYIGPVCRLCRREGMKLFLKGERCYTDKCGYERRAYPPGQHGQARRRKLSEYGVAAAREAEGAAHLRRAERQFRGYYDEAIAQKGVTGENLLQLLERRLDNVVYRLGFASDRAEARQLVRHGHVQVNGKRVEHPVVPRAAPATRSRSGSAARKVTRILESLGRGRAPRRAQVARARQGRLRGQGEGAARRAKT